MKNPSFSSFAQKQAAKNLLRIIFGQAAVLFIANLIFPDSVEWNPRSSNFGKIKVGNTRFDVSGGSASILTLAARLAFGNFKAQSGRIVEIQSGEYGGLDYWDVIWNFAENKVSPVVDAAVKIPASLHGKKDWRSNDLITPQKIAKDLLTPLPIDSVRELIEDPDSANDVLAIILELHGISAQNYSSRSGRPVR